MSAEQSWKRDYYAGALIALIGAYTVVQGRSYNIGTLTRMGPGFFPVMIGVALVLVGMAIAVTATFDGQAKVVIHSPAQWRGWTCIVAGPSLFIAVGRYLGFAPAIFACVFISALGDRTATLRSSLILATVVTIFGVALFSFILNISFPVWRWPHA